MVCGEIVRNRTSQQEGRGGGGTCLSIIFFSMSFFFTSPALGVFAPIHCTGHIHNELHKLNKKNSHVHVVFTHNSFNNYTKRFVLAKSN